MNTNSPAPIPQRSTHHSPLFRMLQAAFLLLLIAGTAYIIGCRGKRQLLYSSGPIFGTSYHIEYEYNERLDSLILGELRAVDGSLSMFNPTSTVTRINSGESMKTDTLFRAVFGISKKISAETGGAFDVTVAPLVNAWGFGFKSGTMPTAHQVDSIMAFVGIDKIRLENGQVVKADKRTMLDFSSVAKGYAVDRVARLFDSCGIRHYMIEIGGEVIVKGRHPEGRPWHIGVSKPVDDGRDLQTTLALSDAAMATSGNYRRFYTRGGRRYAHTIDPHTGRPVQHELLSATVIAPDCATADAYATAFMAMGMAKAKKVLERHRELAAYFIYTTKNGSYATWGTANMTRYYTNLKDKAE